MRPHIAGIILTALAWVLSSGAVAHAQEAVPETPPELRDFRLDEPRPETQPQPESTNQPTQPTTPPPVVRTAPESITERPVPTAQSNQPAPRREAQQSAQSNPTAAQPRPSQSPAAASDSPATEPVAPTVTQRPEPTAPFEPTQSEGNSTLLFGVAAAALLLGLLAFLFGRRRRSNDMNDVEVASAKLADEVPPSPPVTQAKDRLPPPAAPSLAKLTTPPEPEAADISITFIPEKATISFTNLMVQGQLQIANAGRTVAKDMQLRAVLLSASSQQQLAIDTFFADPAQTAPNPLGEAKPGETLGLSLEMSVPLNEMHAFPLGEQRLLVPILVASLTYSGENGETSAARLACMIGREAQPPKPKMGPLRLDKGPRSYAPLGQRSVYA